MNRFPTLALAIASLMLATTGMSFAQTKSQKDKNDMRNLGIGLGALAIHKTLKGDPKTGLALGAGAAYAAKKYDDQRKSQKTSRSYRYSQGKKIGYWVMRGQKRLYYVRYHNR
ncbi:hypothetical protein [Armatimonas sp.]|uniref:hypothetical protein n=1 Tax=Armatimonas sp. TaxID=1872638 RepID=UPI00375397B9